MSSAKDKRRITNELAHQRIARLDSKSNITFDMPHGTAKAFNGKQFQDVTDAEIDALLALLPEDE